MFLSRIVSRAHNAELVSLKNKARVLERKVLELKNTESQNILLTACIQEGREGLMEAETFVEKLEEAERETNEYAQANELLREQMALLREQIVRQEAEHEQKQLSLELVVQGLRGELLSAHECIQGLRSLLVKEQQQQQQPVAFAPSSFDATNAALIEENKRLLEEKAILLAGGPDKKEKAYAFIGKLKDEVLSLKAELRAANKRK